MAPEGTTLQLACPDKSPIQDVLFASFGTPTGYCPTFTRNASCDAPTSLATVKALCVGKTQCAVAAETKTFGPDPCYDVLKRLAVQLQCPSAPTPPPQPPAPSSSFVADFGLEFQGGLRLDVTNGTAGTTVSIACGESLEGNVVGYTWGWEFTWTLRDGPQTLEQHKYMEFRFCSLTVYGPAIGFTLSGWRVNYLWDEADSGFVSSNATLDAVYNLCRYTVHSAALDTYTDSNTRERTVYEADGIIGEYACVVCTSVFVLVLVFVLSSRAARYEIISQKKRLNSLKLTQNSLKTHSNSLSLNKFFRSRLWQAVGAEGLPIRQALTLCGVQQAHVARGVDPHNPLFGLARLHGHGAQRPFHGVH